MQFCPNCAAPKNYSPIQNENYVGNDIIYKARVTLVNYGYGDLSLTTNALFWNKTATTYIAFGVLGSISDNHILIPFESIASIGTYTYIPGGGITLLLKDRKQYKIAFKRKKDYNYVYKYLSEELSGG